LYLLAKQAASGSPKRKEKTTMIENFPKTFLQDDPFKNLKPILNNSWGFGALSLDNNEISTTWNLNSIVMTKSEQKQACHYISDLLLLDFLCMLMSSSPRSLL